MLPEDSFFAEIAGKGISQEEFLSSSWIGLPHCQEVEELKVRFSLPKDAGRAVLLISGLGFFESYLNGKKTDPYYYKPFLTDYAHRPLPEDKRLIPPEIGTAFVDDFLLLDVSSLLKEGENELRVLLAPGYYQSEDRPLEPFPNCYGTKMVRFVLHVERGLDVVSSPRVQGRRLPWKAGLFRGNDEDFSASPSTWENVQAFPSPKEGKPAILNGINDELIQVLKPVETKREKDRLYLDFGENHAGGVHLLIRGKKGQKITIGHAEVLDEEGNLDYRTSRYQELIPGTKTVGGLIDQVSHYVLSGGVDEISPFFNWFCYRYVEILGIGDAEILQVESYDIHAAAKKDSSFSCSEPFYEELETKAIRTIYDNMHAGVITDCPHREKRPYTGDGQIIAGTALYALDSEKFFAKWAEDIFRAQRSDGFVPHTAPHLAGGGGYPWCLAVATVPEKLFKMTGDLSYAEEAYPHVLSFLEFLRNHSEDHIPGEDGQKWLLGDWLAPETVVSSVPLVSSMCYAKALDVAILFAKALGKEDEAAPLQEERDSLTESANRHFYDASTLTYCQGVQGEDVVGYAYFVPEKDKKALGEKIAKHYEDRDYAPDTGFVLTPLLFSSLYEMGRGDVATKMLARKETPSFRAMLENETTFPETWTKVEPGQFVLRGEKLFSKGRVLSHCHPMFGAIVEVIYREVAGLDLEHIYEKKVIFAPKAVGEVKEASFAKMTRFGEAKASYSLSPEGFAYSSVVPEGLTGEVDLSFLPEEYGLTEKRILCPPGENQGFLPAKNRKENREENLSFRRN